jgi:hypothetical protein
MPRTQPLSDRAHGRLVDRPARLVASMGQNFDVPAEGVVDYQYFDVLLDTAEDHWVQAVEIRPARARSCTT